MFLIARGKKNNLSAETEINKSNPIVLPLDVYRGMICCFHMVIYKWWALHKEQGL